MKSPREPRFVCGTSREQSIAAQLLAPVALFVVGAAIVGTGYLAIGGDRP